ncbi:metallophosphoesterase family protein [Paenibacillus eucommiae]|uniref:DNA repair exonuclease SbcCD nuclease subunit n=1 Tax=Paenibacillus eucommiae TaxID=1355755 RepID=A0ABS4INT4_9BACL|nr:DNA repair exonuclease [Paenibacillus eucommiae]MBP1989213.1 DNA repair exonuclease SbcCD nuclease subunit [Paenibacillus eucommiae]
MQRLRFIHAADLHLDSPFKGMTELPPQLREQVRESTFEALRQLVALAIREQVDFVLIGGDVYDLADRSLRAQLRFQKAVQQLADHNIPTYIIHGNHDPEDGRAARLTWPAAVHFFACDQVETIEVEKPGRGVIAHIHGISYKTAAVTENLALQFRALDSAIYQIGLLHTNVDGDAGHDNYAPCSKQDLLRRGMHYWALGHVHTRKVLNDSPAIVYPGNLQGRSIRETGPRGCYLVNVDEDGAAELSFQELDCLRWHVVKLSIRDIRTEQELRSMLEEHMDVIRFAAEGRDSIVRVILEGRGPVHELLRKGRALAELMADLREEEAARIGGAARGLDLNPLSQAGFVWIESMEDRSGSEIDRALLLQQKSFAGDLLRLSQSLQLDEAALQAFAGEALAALQALPQAAGGPPALEQERLQQWLHAAEELAADLLAAGRGWDG